MKFDYKKPIKYNKEHKIELFCDFIIKNAPKNKSFSIKDFLINNLPDENPLIINDLFSDVRVRLIRMEKLEFIKKLGKCKFIDDNIDIINNFNNDFSNSNIGVLNQSSRNIDLKSPIEQKINNQTPNKPIKKSKLEMLSWLFGIIVSLILIYKFIIEYI